MTTFWIAAAGLVGLAWLIVLPSLLRRRAPLPPATHHAASLAVLREQLDQVNDDGAAGRIDAAQQATATADIERRALDDASDASIAAAPFRGAAPTPALAAVTAAVIGVAAFGLYAHFGNHDALAPQAVASAASAASDAVTQQQVEAMVDQLALRLTNDPALANDVRAWTMLGRSAAALRRFDQAKVAYARAVALTPNDAQLLVDQADVMAMLQGQSLNGEPIRLVERALQIDPNNVKALAMAGSAAFERHDYAEAIRRWIAARRLVEAGTDLASGLDQSIAEAQQATAAQPGGSAATASALPDRTAAGSTGDLAGGSTVRSVAGSTSDSATTAAREIVGRVAITPALAGRVAPEDTVFVYARAVTGPRMPLAILRRKGSDLPFSFQLNDALAMSPMMKLSSVDSVIVEARVSRTGSAAPQPGDLFVRSAALSRSDGKVDLLIDAVTP